MKSIGTRELKTDRLVLRKFKEDDAEELYRNYGSDSNVNKYISFAPCITPEATRGFLAMNLSEYEGNPDFYSWAITLNGAIIGTISLFNVDEAEHCELGYSIGSRWWGKGYVTEAARRVIGYAFSDIKMHRVYASHHKDNLASGRILNKIGMTYEGTLRDGQKNADGTYSDLKLYSIIETDL